MVGWIQEEQPYGKVVLGSSPQVVCSYKAAFAVKDLATNNSYK